MSTTKAKQSSGQLIQFSPYSRDLPVRLAKDVQNSSYTTKTKYLNALLERLLGEPPRLRVDSRIDELFQMLSIMESLPLERIDAIASMENRHFDQMFVHLIQTALREYPDCPNKAPVGVESRRRFSIN